MDHIKSIIRASVDVKQELLGNEALITQVEEIVELIVGVFDNDQKVLLCGNGGSAADAAHIAAELSGRFYKDRDPLFAEALHGNPSYLTAVANDYGYEEVYARLVKGMAKKGDVLFCLSTSGTSPNVVRAAESAKEAGVFVVGMTGETGGILAECCHYLLNVPSIDTPRIQECHMLLGHIICQLVEERIFGD